MSDEEAVREHVRGILKRLIATGGTSQNDSTVDVAVSDRNDAKQRRLAHELPIVENEREEVRGR